MLKISFLSKSKWFDIISLKQMQKIKGGDSETRMSNDRVDPVADDNDQPIIL